MQVRHGRPPDRTAGWIDVGVQAVSTTANPFGARISINDHYEVSVERQAILKSQRAVSDELLDLLEANFDRSNERSLQFLSNILDGT